MPEIVEMYHKESRNTVQRVRGLAVPYCIHKPRSFREKRSFIAMNASRLFIEKGYHRTSIRDICRATGMTIGNIYNYFSGKEGILYLVFTRYYDRLRNILFDEKVFAKGDPKQSLRQFIYNYISRRNDFADEMMMINCESRFSSKENLLKSRMQEIEDVNELEKIVRAGVNVGVFKVKDTYFAAAMILYQLSVLAMKAWVFEGKYSEKAIAALLEESIMKAVS